jgi:hypothetical protein
VAQLVRAPKDRTDVEAIELGDLRRYERALPDLRAYDALLADDREVQS